MAIGTNKDLADALKRGDDYIEVEGDLATKVVRIRATGKVAWAIAIAAIAIVVVATIAAIATGGTSEVAAVAAAPAALAVLGGPTTYAAIAVAVAAGGVGALTSLREYKEVSHSNGLLILKKR
ncbi:hypothetical protein LMG27952_04760 [Paraburkholderia hiiakae]|uniref:Holin-X, holin superfamily III n=1 Tax=Paraburkholderia hiiakae TaxID=1081782 RepID=A0ABM8NXZ1_9BURK|nr:hypothetical protein [Paraburkholderia hiiakae]CAD6548634.1 hypothetical protein LMG27952_04760 [Paraburkholderia hiiakae]